MTGGTEEGLNNSSRVGQVERQRSPNTGKVRNSRWSALRLTRPTPCARASGATSRCRCRGCPWVIVDNADAPGAIVLLSAAKTLPGWEASIGIVLAVSPNSIGCGRRAQSYGALSPTVGRSVAQWNQVRPWTEK